MGKSFAVLLLLCTIHCTTSKFYSQSNDRTIKNNVLSGLENLSATQCQLRCNRKSSCEKIAIDEKGKCYLLSKKGSENAQQDITSQDGVRYFQLSNLGGFNNSIGPYSVVNEDKLRRRITLVTSNMMALVESCPHYKIHTDVTFKARRDDSHSSTKFTYYRLDTNRKETFLFKGGVSDHTTVSFDGTHMKCSGDQCKGLPRNKAVSVIPLEVDFNPRHGSAWANGWSRNRYSISGSFIQIVCPNE